MEGMIDANITIPEYDKPVLVYYITKKNEKRYGIAYLHYNANTKQQQWILGTNIGFALSNVTHWQYLPEILE